jgi:hypothetical protein
LTAVPGRIGARPTAWIILSTAVRNAVIETSGGASMNGGAIGAVSASGTVFSTIAIELAAAAFAGGHDRWYRPQFWLHQSGCMRSARIQQVAAIPAYPPPLRNHRDDETGASVRLREFRIASEAF